MSRLANMHGRYLSFLHALHDAADKNTPSIISKLTKANNVSAYAFKAAQDMGVITVSHVKNKRTIRISWTAATAPSDGDADRLIEKVREINNENKAKLKLKPKKVKVKPVVVVAEQRYAEVTINSAKVRVPVINNTVELEVGDSKIIINMS